MEKVPDERNYSGVKSVVIAGLIISFLTMLATFLGVIKWEPIPNPISGEGETQRLAGGWRSETSSNSYTIEPRGDHDFLFREAATGDIIGLGNITKNKVVINATHPIKNRSAVFNLQLSEDGTAMTGTMQGEAPIEKGFVSFRKLPSG